MYLVKLISNKRNYFSIGKDYTNSVSIIVHSDTLFSAICNNFRKLYGNNALDTFLKQLTRLNHTEERHFRLSSCFHYIDIYKNSTYSDTIHFLPKPLIRLPLDARSQSYFDENPKIFKKIQFISFSLFRKLQRGQNISISPYHIINGKYALDEKDLEAMGLKRFVKLREEYDAKLEKIERAIRRKITIFEILDEQKVTIDRMSRNSKPFTWSKFKFRTSEYFIDQKNEQINYKLIPGFYFLLDYSGLEEVSINKIHSSIKLIIDEGLGGKRSLGCGLVDDIVIQKIDKNFTFFDIFEKQDNGYYTNLSLVYPNVDEIEHVKYFNIYGRSGFVYSLDNNSQRFKDVRFIEEGAIFDKKLRGRLVQVASDDFSSQFHKIFKNGLGIYLNIGQIEVD